ncbi:MAG: phospholipase D family protein [Opitutaceae bacterium]|jgi:putative cardiolipin synthase|nr:phospholipase D family protein [Opitutaceae bacterium]
MRLSTGKQTPAGGTRGRAGKRGAVPATLAASLLLLAGCGSLPKKTADMRSLALADTSETTLGRLAADGIREHPGLSGLMALKQGRDAFLARLALARLAERSLDLQYYIWRDDFTGRLLLREALRAADRGVRVRLLIDDMGTHPRDADMLALAAHPLFEVRYFNPARHRSLRLANLMVESGRMNHRMHNKTFLADNAAAIIGGRNIGDEYFEAHPDVSFDDLDVLCIGAVVPAASAAFDGFWNDARSVPVGLFYPGENAAAALERLRARWEREKPSETQREYMTAPRAREFAARLRDKSPPLEWGRAWALYDDPGKSLDDDGEDAPTVLEAMKPFGDAAREELLIVSPYFVPGKTGLAWLDGFVRRGVRVSVLTNSLASTDVSLVHAGYAHYRRPMLRAGVALHELKAAPGAAKRRWFGSSRSSLHAKTFVFDRRFVFVGTLNLDPRSIELNTENGVVFESAPFARELAESFAKTVAQDAYALRLDRGFLRWVDGADGTVLRSEPGTSWWRRLCVGLFALLPVESQL